MDFDAVVRPAGLVVVITGGVSLTIITRVRVIFSMSH
jgi:hypothetical protein